MEIDYSIMSSDAVALIYARKPAVTMFGLELEKQIYKDDPEGLLSIDSRRLSAKKVIFLKEVILP